MACSRTWCGVCCSGLYAFISSVRLWVWRGRVPTLSYGCVRSGTFLEGPDVCYRTRAREVCITRLSASLPAISRFSYRAHSTTLTLTLYSLSVLSVTTTITLELRAQGAHVPPQ